MMFISTVKRKSKVSNEGCNEYIVTNVSNLLRFREISARVHYPRGLTGTHHEAQLLDQLFAALLFAVSCKALLSIQTTHQVNSTLPPINFALLNTSPYLFYHPHNVHNYCIITSVSL